MGTAADTNVPLNVTAKIIANPNQSFLSISMMSPTEIRRGGHVMPFPVELQTGRGHNCKWPFPMGEPGQSTNDKRARHPPVAGEEGYFARYRAALAGEFQKIPDHSGIVWNCWTGLLSPLGLVRANALESRTSRGADADAARVRALAAYKDDPTPGCSCKIRNFC